MSWRFARPTVLGARPAATSSSPPTRSRSTSCSSSAPSSRSPARSARSCSCARGTSSPTARPRRPAWRRAARGAGARWCGAAQRRRPACRPARLTAPLRGRAPAGYPHAHARPLALLGALALASPWAPRGLRRRPRPPPRIPAGVAAGGVDLSGRTVLQAAAKLKPAVHPGAADRRRARRRGQALPLRAAGADRARRDPTAQARARRPRRRRGRRSPCRCVHTRRGPSRPSPSASPLRSQRRPRNATGQSDCENHASGAPAAASALDVAAARQLVDAALDDPTKPKVLHQAVCAVAPRRQRQRPAPALVRTVDHGGQGGFKLRLFKNLKVVKTYGVAVGQPAYPTPSGPVLDHDKQVNPTWSVPNSPWAGELQGTTVEGGSAANPLKARWMGIVNGVGIHGTGEDYSIGSRGVARLHPHARRRRDRAVRARARRHARAACSSPARPLRSARGRRARWRARASRRPSGARVTSVPNSRTRMTALTSSPATSRTAPTPNVNAVICGDVDRLAGHLDEAVGQHRQPQPGAGRRQRDDPPAALRGHHQHDRGRASPAARRPP